MLDGELANIRAFRVVPDLPQPLEPLRELAHNMWWTWHPEAVELFTRLDRQLWEETNHNPVKLLGRIDQRLLDRYAQDQSYLHALSFVHKRFTSHLTRRSWFATHHPELVPGAGATDGAAAHAGGHSPGGGAPHAPTDAAGEPFKVAYFSAEFGLAECLQIYSGGLGCLAGDHVKSASELGLPLVGVGLLYRCGYFHQYLNADGWQQETYPAIDFANQPVERVLDPATGEQVTVSVDLPGRSVIAAVWRCEVGRVSLYLLDTNRHENARQDRDITKTLYGGDIETRIQQEIVLGIGGARALEAVGERPSVWHINEGHAAFLSLERIARLREAHGVGFEEALQAAAAGNVFTTHTPVPAGIDRFAPDLVERYLGGMVGRLGCSMERILGLGRANPFDGGEFFSMAVLALRCSQFSNGVSELHGHVSRSMWSHLWPGLPEGEVPIGHVTNGVHPRTWIHEELVQLYDRYIDPSWQLDPTEEDGWEQVFEIPDEQLWLFRQRRRQEMVTWVRQRLRDQLSRRGATGEEIDRAMGALGADVLTVGFARRFATYKRGTLLMHDVERLRALLSDADRPVQVLVAGKAHPADKPGKELIRELVKLGERDDAFLRVVFLEDYDMEVARELVQGCDVWLNTPRRGMEASGTSGMKAAMNGGINVSILDGWWDEAYERELGFAIGHGERYEDDEYADAVESRALYDLLERQIVPEFYERTASGLPRGWIGRMKRSMARLTPRFSTNRMVCDYARRYYLSADRLGRALTAEGCAGAGELASRLSRWREAWGGVGVREVLTDAGSSLRVHGEARVRALVDLGGLSAEEVRVELYVGEVTSRGDLVEAESIAMTHAGHEDGSAVFDGSFVASRSGQRGFTVRVVPRDERLVGTKVPGLIAWDRDAPTRRVERLEPFSAGAGVEEIAG